MLRFVMLGLALLGAPPVGAEPATPTAGRVEIVRVFGPDLFEVAQDGVRARFRVRGVDAVRRGDGEIFRESLASVREWTAKGAVRIYDTSAGRAGESLGRMRLVDGALLAERLLQHGFGLVDPGPLRASDLELLLRAQADGRANRRGVWSIGKRDAAKATDQTGRFVSACAETSGVTEERDGSWLLFLGGSPPRRDIGVRIPAAAAARFPRPDRVYLNRQICALGRLRKSPIAPEILAVDPSQIEVETRRH